MSNQYTLVAAGNIEAPAYYLILKKGFTVKCENELWYAEKEEIKVIGDSPIILLGLISIYKIKGQKWQVSDDEICDFVNKFFK